MTLRSGVRLRLFPIEGKVLLYLENWAEAAEDDTVGACFAHDGATLFYIPGCAAMTRSLAKRLRGADTVMFDGTLWRDER